MTTLAKPSTPQGALAPRESALGATPVFQVERLTRNFGALRAVDDISTEIHSGERIALIGSSGAGKTTLLRLLSGVLRPSSGRIVAGTEINSSSQSFSRALRSRIGFLYQTDNVVPSLRVVHNVLMGKLGRWGLFSSLISLIWPLSRERVRECLRAVELEDKFWATTDTLSGGQQQRVAIARLLMQEPKVILADEPVSSLDPRLGREVISLICERAAGEDTTVLVSLHTLELLYTHFTRVIAMRDGAVVYDGSPHDLDRKDFEMIYGEEIRDLHLDEVLQARKSEA